MKMNTLEKLWRCMADRSPELVMPESLRLASYKPLKRMLDWS
jgi:quinolinate synthase